MGINRCGSGRGNINSKRMTEDPHIPKKLFAITR